MLKKSNYKLGRDGVFSGVILFVATYLIVANVALAAPSKLMSGAATFIRPTGGQVTLVETDIQGVLKTNITLVPIGQIPVLATNVYYQLVITKANVFSTYFDTVVLTNATGGPHPVLNFGGPLYSCLDILVTNVVGAQTNVTTIGSTCTLNSDKTSVIFIATNSIPADVQYYTLVTTNLFFDPNNARCWQAVYYTNLTVTAAVVTNVITAECGHPLAGSPLARGMLKLTENSQGQTFLIKVTDILVDPLAPPPGLAVFIGDSICDNSLTNLGLMLKSGTNNAYKLNLVSTPANPLPFVVSNLSELTNKVLQICDQNTNVYLQATIPALVEELNRLTYTHSVKMQKPTVPSSKRAAGLIRANFTGTSGRSLFEIRVSGLNPGNAYTVSLIGLETETYSLVYNRFLSFDTAKGNELPFGAVTVSELNGVVVEIRDAFGTVHLSGRLLW